MTKKVKVSIPPLDVLLLPPPTPTEAKTHHLSTKEVVVVEEKAIFPGFLLILGGMGREVDQ